MSDPAPEASEGARLMAAGLGRYLFTAEEVAQSLAVSTSLVRQLTTYGELPCRRIGRLVRYSAADLEAFVQSLEHHSYGATSKLNRQAT